MASECAPGPRSLGTKYDPLQLPVYELPLSPPRSPSPPPQSPPSHHPHYHHKQLQSTTSYLTHPNHPDHHHHHHPHLQNTMITSTSSSGSSSPSTSESRKSTVSTSSPRPLSSASTLEMTETTSSSMFSDDEDEHVSPRHSTPHRKRSTTPSETVVFFDGHHTQHSEILHLPRRLSSSLSSHSSAPSTTSSSSSGNSTASSTLSSSSTNLNSSINHISLATILDVFQHNISETEAWALIYQCALSLKQLIFDYEKKLPTISTFSGESRFLKLVEVTDFADLFLTSSGAIHQSTWFSKTRKTEIKEKEVILVKNSRSLNTVLAHLSALIYKAITHKLYKSTNQKTSLKQKFSYPQKEGVLETNLDAESSESEEEDDQLEPDINSDLENLLIFMIRSKDLSTINNVNDSDCEEEVGDEGIDDVDDDDEVEDDENSDGSSPELPSAILSKSALPSVFKRCERHFDVQWGELQLKNAVASSNEDNNLPKNGNLSRTLSTTSTCPILTSLFEGKSRGQLDPATYYTTVIEHMLDEYEKLKQLLKQIELEKGCDDADGRSSGHLAFRRSSAIQMKNKTLNDLPDTESLKLWAQSWIKIMSELRFGVRLKHTNLEEEDPRMNRFPQTPQSPKRPYEALMEQIRTTKKEQLRSSKEIRPASHLLIKHSQSMPCLDYRLTINQEVIRQKRSNLKPASRRKLPDRPPVEPCLHDLLMAEIKDQGGGNTSKDGVQRRKKLTSVETIVKPDIVELYFKERKELEKKRIAQSRSFPRVKSAIVLPRVHSPTFKQNNDQFLMNEPSSNYSSTSSLLCGRCSSSSFKNGDSEEVKGKQSHLKTPEMDCGHHKSGGGFLQRFRSLSVSKLAKRKNQATDDSFNTSLPRTPERTSSIIFSSKPENETPKTRRHFIKKSRPTSDAFISSSLSTSSYSSPLATGNPFIGSLNHNSSTLYHTGNSRHSPIPAQWITKPSSTFSTSNTSNSNVFSGSPQTPCLRHTSRATSNPSFVHTVSYPCTCQNLGTSTNSINFDLNQQTLTPTTPTRLFNSNFQTNVHLRRSYVKSKAQPLQQPSSNFDQLSLSFNSTTKLRRANSVMFGVHQKAEKVASIAGHNVISKSQSKWSFSNLFSKITNIGSSSGVGAKVKRE